MNKIIARELEIESMDEIDPHGDFMQSALYVKYGLPTTSTITLTNTGSFSVTIESAGKWKKYTLLNGAQWIEIFEMKHSVN